MPVAWWSASQPSAMPIAIVTSMPQPIASIDVTLDDDGAGGVGVGVLERGPSGEVKLARGAAGAWARSARRVEAIGGAIGEGAGGVGAIGAGGATGAGAESPTP